MEEACIKLSEKSAAEGRVGASLRIVLEGTPRLLLLMIVVLVWAAAMATSSATTSR